MFSCNTTDSSISHSNNVCFDSPNSVLNNNYYIGISPLVDEYSDFSIDISTTVVSNSEYKYDICFSDNEFFKYDLIKTDVDDIHIQNGVICQDINGNQKRICPEPDCSIDNICNHIVIKYESIVSYENYLFICGLPWLGEDFYQNTCIMRFDLLTNEYIKYAELPHKNVDLFVYSNYLFAAVRTSEKHVVLYCFDLINDNGYKLIFRSKNNSPAFLGILNNYIVVKDHKTLYLLDKNGEIIKSFEVGGIIGCYKIYNDTLFYELNHQLYEYDFSLNSSKVLIDNCYNFDIYNDIIYYFKYEKVDGLEYLESYVDESGYISYRVTDYPLFNGTAIYSYNLNTSVHDICFTIYDNRYLNDVLKVSKYGFVYGYYVSPPSPQQYFSSNTVLIDLNTHNEISISNYWAGRRRSYEP